MTQMPARDTSPVLVDRLRSFLLKVIGVHPMITDVAIQRRGQLHNSIMLLLIISSLSGLVSGPEVKTPFIFMLVISSVSFVLGKTETPENGAFLFIFGFATITYLSVYFGYTNDYPGLILSMIPITLIVASALVRQRVFAGLIIYVVAATFLAPLYSAKLITTNDTLRTGGVVTALGAMLYGINIFRRYLESSRVRHLNLENQQLTAAKNNMEGQAHLYEQQLGAANGQIQIQAARLQAAAEISQRIADSVNTDLNEALAAIVEIISEKMNFYHVGVFLLDKKREYAELRAANSKGGKRMLDRRHQLKVGGTGIVGYVAQSGFPRIALSTGADAVFFNNPDLPDTRSEMALPLKAGNMVIGVLDVQSSLPAAFKTEDTHAFDVLASQLALLIFDKQIAEQTLRTEKKKEASQLTSSHERQLGYTYFLDGTIAAARAESSPALEKALKSSEVVALPATASHPVPTLAVPVKIRDIFIGYIHIEAGEGTRKWTEDEVTVVQAIADRAALALENARLFEETERRAEQEQIMAQVTAHIGESTNFERILQTTIQELGRTLKARRAYIQINPLTPGRGDAPGRQGF